MRMTADHILVRPIKWPSLKQSGNSRIIQPESSDLRKMFGLGRVLAKGPGMFTSAGVQLPPDAIKKDDRVIYYKESVVPFTSGETEELHLLREVNILAILDAGEFIETEF